jgi:hypothetical protein
MSGISTSATGDVTLAGDNEFTGTNTFNTNRPTSTIATTPGSTNLITKQNADALYAAISVDGDVKLDGDPNTFVGTNTFNTNRPTSTLTSTPGSTDFITKQNADALYAAISVTGDVTKSGGTDVSPQTFTGYNKFNNDVDMADNLVFTGAAVNNVPNIRINGVDNFISMTGDIIQTASNSQFKTDGELLIGGNVRIGSDTDSAECPLEVTGHSGTTGTAYATRSYFVYGMNNIATNQGNFTEISIFAQSHVVSNGFFLSTAGSFGSSDIRIKKDVNTIDEAESLEKIRKIRPVNYKYIDDRTHGTTTQAGFIAQEINEVLPSSVKLMERHIPNIYECVKVSDTYTITFPKSTPLNVGDKLQFYGVCNVPRNTTITEVINDTTIKIKDDFSGDFCDMSGNKGGDCLFCYGELIKDYHHLKYDEVFTTLLSAVKLMDKRITELEAQINKI